MRKPRTVINISLKPIETRQSLGTGLSAFLFRVTVRVPLWNEMSLQRPIQRRSQQELRNSCLSLRWEAKPMAAQTLRLSGLQWVAGLSDLGEDGVW